MYSCLRVHPGDLHWGHILFFTWFFICINMYHAILHLKIMFTCWLILITKWFRISLWCARICYNFFLPWNNISWVVASMTSWPCWHQWQFHQQSPPLSLMTTTHAPPMSMLPFCLHLSLCLHLSPFGINGKGCPHTCAWNLWTLLTAPPVNMLVLFLFCCKLHLRTDFLTLSRTNS